MVQNKNEISDEAVEFLASMERSASSANDSIVPTGERLCPICREKMATQTDYDIQLDVCTRHGVWLDHHELAAIASRIRSGERIERVNAIRDARRSGKMSGAFFGIWSLLFDY